MGTFAMWLEAKNNGLNENNIDDHKLVAMLNETFRLHRAFIKRIVETGGDGEGPSPEEAQEILKEKNPTLWQKIRNLGPYAAVAALTAIGMYDVSVPYGMRKPVQKYVTGPITKLMGSEVGDLRGNVKTDDPTGKAMAAQQDLAKLMNRERKQANDPEIAATRELMRYKQGRGDPDWRPPVKLPAR